MTTATPEPTNTTTVVTAPGPTNVMTATPEPTNSPPGLWISSHHRILSTVVVGANHRIVSTVIVGANHRILSTVVVGAVHRIHGQCVGHFGGLNICDILGLLILHCLAINGDKQSKEQERNLRLHFLQ